MALLSSDDVAYLRAQAGARGVNADDLMKVIQYESSGRPDVWGGKNNQYFGLLQFGPEERAKFGVDTAHPNARNQIDAGFKFLEARGFKPNMGLLDLYSTINAGSPGHYSASDRPGMTVASHVARMGGAAPQSPQNPQFPPFVEEVASEEPIDDRPARPVSLGLLAAPTTSEIIDFSMIPKPILKPMPQRRGIASKKLAFKRG